LITAGLGPASLSPAAAPPGPCPRKLVTMSEDREHPLNLRGLDGLVFRGGASFRAEQSAARTRRTEAETAEATARRKRDRELLNSIPVRDTQALRTIAAELAKAVQPRSGLRACETFTFTLICRACAAGAFLGHDWLVFREYINAKPMLWHAFGWIRLNARKVGLTAQHEFKNWHEHLDQARKVFSSLIDRESANCDGADDFTLTNVEVARLLNVSPGHVSRLVKPGGLRDNGKKGRERRYSRSSAEQIRKNRAKGSSEKEPSPKEQEAIRARINAACKHRATLRNNLD
jgi:hypothetical protein